MDEGRQFSLVHVHFGDMIEDHGGDVVHLLHKVFTVYLDEGEFKVAVEVADGLELSPEAVVDQDERKGFFYRILPQHTPMMPKFIFV